MNNKPSKHFLLKFITATVFIVIMGSQCFADAPKSNAPRIRVYKQGRVIKINPQGKNYAQLKESCESLLNSRGKFIPIKASKYKKWLGAKKWRNAVELIYPRQKRFRLSGMESYATRFVIPLTAVATTRKSPYGAYTEIFVFSDLGEKEAQVGPFSTQQSLEPLRKLARNIK